MPNQSGQPFAEILRKMKVMEKRDDDEAVLKVESVDVILNRPNCARFDLYKRGPRACELLRYPREELLSESVRPARSGTRCIAWKSTTI